jgi:hypothetical protein
VKISSVYPTKDKPLFIIGTGPSLASCDITKLKNCYTMSFNRSFIAYKDWGFEPTYYVGLDTVVNNDNRIAIKKLIKKSSIKEFFFSKNEQTINDFSSVKSTLIDYIDDPTHPNLDFKNGLKVGNSGLFGLQIAIGILGFKEIYLLGCDANYTDKVNKVVIKENGHYYSTDNSDSNHFRKDYYGKGTTYNKPAAEKYHYPAWLAFYKQVVSKDKSINVYNCSSTGRLQFFKFCNFSKLIKSKKFNKISMNSLEKSHLYDLYNFYYQKVSWLPNKQMEGTPTSSVNSSRELQLSSEIQTLNTYLFEIKNELTIAKSTLNEISSSKLWRISKKIYSVKDFLKSLIKK